ncbi:hypothetical protein HYH02_015307 [Chlamydomonas schloesseri]|uniref:Uncharacterized protein n=1 Tax=Chlamydomonas schloesseri TaxID=2026947 RepID=A0A835SAA5_9CHLO|nr:hypothetical protein HYH02_015307 [Chlamydomonas schloesseri]|eukprot:KAG2423607.1 hypothetical protein HYH02_015307 [Chlamydomonas schloesseri]
MRHHREEPQRPQGAHKAPAFFASASSSRSGGHDPPTAAHNKALLASLMLAAALVGYAAGAWGGGGGAAGAGYSEYELAAGHGLGGKHWRWQAATSSSSAGPDTPQPTTFEPAFPENRAAALASRAAAAAAVAAEAAAAEGAAAAQAGTAEAGRSVPGGSVGSSVGSNGSVGGAAVMLLRDEVAYLRRKVRSLRLSYGAAYCDLHGIGPSGGFCQHPQPPAATAAAAPTTAAAAAAAAGLATSTMLDRPLCAAIAELVAGTHVADFGAGRGQYGTCLRTGGAGGALSYTAYDGGEGVEAATGGAVRFLDLAEPTWLGVTYDWVVSLEVGEHIPAALESTFLANLLRHARRGLVLSWAVPGQGGHQHVNERPNDYILAKVAALGGGGFAHNATATEKLRAASSLSWFRNTLLVFDRM